MGRFAGGRGALTSMTGSVPPSRVRGGRGDVGVVVSVGVGSEVWADAGLAIKPVRTTNARLDTETSKRADILPPARADTVGTPATRLAKGLVPTPTIATLRGGRFII